MEVNKDEALRCLSIAQRHRGSSNLTAALKFARKSVSLYRTPEGEAMVVVIEREIATGGAASAGGSSSPPATPSTPNGSSSARATGVEEHVTSAHRRHPEKKEEAGSSSKTATDAKGKKREYTVKQLEVVTRIKKCREYEYYEILAVERTCSENDVKRAYKKLALALHPDKNGAPGADEAFKMVSKAFQILSDNDLRASFDSNPGVDPTQRGGGGGGGMARGFGGGGMHPGFGGGGGFHGEMNPEDLFNMFFGGGGMQGGFGQSPFGGARVYTFGGNNGFGQGFNNARRARNAAGGMDEAPQSPLMALLPVGILLLFVMFSLIPTLFSGPHIPDPNFRFQPSEQYDMARKTWQHHIPYYVNKGEWEQWPVWDDVPEKRRDQPDVYKYSRKVRAFERDVEQVQIQYLQTECRSFEATKQRKIAEEAGLFGIGADMAKIRDLRAQTHQACEQLKRFGVTMQPF
ncbi:Chaperone protein dnaJ [Vanrija albida]|uniref:Chaperone protein dnaJ n=1 Tax=Vanrija albida TaxID=181172 RepID=A0ABR3PUN3_9TREE